MPDPDETDRTDPSPGEPPPTRRNKRQLQAEATRDRLVTAAREVFESKGYSEASVALITKQADTAHGTFYLYFKNKDDAFMEVIREVGEEMRDLSRAQLTGDRRESLEGVVRAFFEVFADHAPLWRALLEGMMLSRPIEDLWWATSRSFIERIAHRLAREQELGLIRAIPDTRRAAEALASMAEWTAFRRFASSDRIGNISAEDIDAAVVSVTDLWFQAVYGRADPSQLR